MVMEKNSLRDIGTVILSDFLDKTSESTSSSSYNNKQGIKIFTK